VIVMKKSAVLLLACAVVASLPARPAAAGPNKEYLQLLAEIRMLQEQNQQLQQLFGTLQDSLKAFSTKLDEQAATNRKGMADQTLAMTNIGDTVRVLREKADDTNVRISTVAQEIQALRQSLASMPAQQQAVPVNPSPAGGDPGAAATSPSAPTTSAPAVPLGVSPQKMFESAYDDFTSSRYQTAIEGFDLFIRTFPNMPQAADAQFNIGASYFNLGKWNEARDALLAVTQKYPQATDANAGAYFKLGQTYEALKQIDNAKKAYETLVQRYPTSFQATQASQSLQRLNRR
jgi:tol-pal system protein YbgF